MSSKRRLRRKSCEGKQQHDDKTKAIAHKMRLIEDGLAVRGELWVYRCEFCKKWHVGHPTLEMRQKRVFFSDRT